MGHADNQEGDEEGSAKERSGETGSGVEMGCHGGWSGKEEFNESRDSCCCYCVSGRWILATASKCRVEDIIANILPIVQPSQRYE